MQGQSFSHYEVLERLGGGGMGVVYKARQLALDRTVALKTINTGGADEGFPTRFLLEASMTAKLAHSNTVRIFDFGRAEDGTCFLAMEFLDGRPMREIVNESDAMDPVRVIHIAEQVCGSLQEAHESEIIHRDIKPENIMLVRQGSDDDHVKVVDFGLVKRVGVDSGATIEGAMVGSPHYMAPEQVKADKAIDGRADIYALGMVMYEALMGRVAFPQANMAQLMYAQVHSAPAPMADVPMELEAIVMKCLEKRPADRYQTAEELGSALHLVFKSLGGTGGHLVLTTMEEQRPRSWMPFLASSAALVAVAGLAVIGWGAAAFLVVSPVDDVLVKRAANPPSIAEVQPLPAVQVVPDPAPAADVAVITPDVVEAPELPIRRGRTTASKVAPSARADLMRFESMPPGASIFVDGRKVGITPKSTAVTAGVHKIRMVRGGMSIERTIRAPSSTSTGYLWDTRKNAWTPLR